MTYQMTEIIPNPTKTAEASVVSSTSRGDLQFIVCAVTGIAVGKDSKGNAKIYHKIATLRVSALLSRQV